MKYYTLFLLNRRRVVKVRINPKFNKIIVKEIREEKSPGGIIMPVVHEKYVGYGVVIAVGPGRTTEYGVIIPCCVVPGDKITFSMNVVTKITIDGIEYWVMPDQEVIVTHEEEVCQSQQ